MSTFQSGFESGKQTMEEMLLALEEAGWQGLSNENGSDFYRRVLTDDAVLIVPGMVLDGTTFVHALESGAQPWAWHRIEEARVVPFTADCAAVVYRVTAQRQGQPPYVALMSSVYVKHDDGWRLAFHQQTPTPSGHAG